MAKENFSGQIAKKILLATASVAATGSVVLIFSAMPGLGMVAREILKWYEAETPTNRFRIKRTFKELRKARLVQTQEMPDGSTKLILNAKGERKILQYRFDDLVLKQNLKWDGKWRFVIFDIPKRYNRERELWRKKLSALSFYQLQRSVWISPFPCRDEIDFVSEYLKLSSCIRIIEATDFDGSNEIKRMFFDIKRD